MSADYQTLRFEYQPSADEEAPEPAHHPVAVVGAGPVGLAAAIDLAQQGVPVVLLDDDDTLSTGSRAICFAKRSLEIFDRLRCGERMIEKGVSWNHGKVFFQGELVYEFDLLPEEGHKRPAFINLQQYYVEGYLVERAQQLAGLELRWKNKVIGVEPDAHGVTLTAQTPRGRYKLRADYVVAADGARSPIRALMGLESKGQVFRDRFLIADVVMKHDFPTERWFWFDPPFHRGQSALLHKQPDDVWRIDFQLGWDADPVEERRPERVIPRVKAMLGEKVEFDLAWVSVYTFACLRMERFRHGRVLFAGDSAHGVSPFGARGANSGIQDAENLAWKLKLVLDGQAPDRLLDTYDEERVYAADENILNSTRSTDFITPKSRVSRTFRDAVLGLAKNAPFARRLVNSGRLSVPAVLAASSLNTPDRDPFAGAMLPGAPALDAPVRRDGAAAWLLESLQGGFVGLYYAGNALLESDAAALAALADSAIPVKPLLVARAGASGQFDSSGLETLEDVQGLAAQRYDLQPRSFYLFRPDQHVAARFRRFEAAHVHAAVERASCNA